MLKIGGGTEKSHKNDLWAEKDLIVRTVKNSICLAYKRKKKENWGVTGLNIISIFSGRKCRLLRVFLNWRETV